MALSKTDILNAKDANIATVAVPEWGGDVCIRVMSVGERDAYECEWLGKQDKGVENFRSKLLARCLCDEDGNRLFTDAEVEELSKKSIHVMERLFKKAIEHNAIAQSDVEEAAKN